MEAPREIHLDPVKLKGSLITYIGAIVPENRVEVGDIKYIRTDLAELTWKKVQDIWFITDKVLHSIPEDTSKWEEWMFSTQGRFTKALGEINKYWKSIDFFERFV